MRFEFEGLSFPEGFDRELAMRLGENQGREVIAVRAGYADPVFVGTIGGTTGDHAALLVEKYDIAGDLVERADIVALYGGDWGELLWDNGNENPFGVHTPPMNKSHLYDCSVFIREHRIDRRLIFLLRGGAGNCIEVGRRTDVPDYDDETDEYTRTFAVEGTQYDVADVLTICNLDGDVLWYHPSLTSEPITD